MNFRKDINGLRAIAVIAVVLFHFNSLWMPGGFAGVDVFFVISGFLMTRIIFGGIEKNTFSIFAFYIARANRIIPALSVLCLALFSFAWFFALDVEFELISKHIISSVSFLSNFHYWRESGYFEASSHEKWLLHTWSLSVEWQFYIIYPLILLAIRQLISIKVAKITVLVGAVLGFILCVFLTYKSPNAAYFLLPSRAWEMMIGGVAYLYPLAIKDKNKKLLEWFGLVLIISSYFYISKEYPWPGYMAIFPVLGSYFIIQAQRNDSLITSNIVLQKLGTWSYSIYLWHWPLVVYMYTYMETSVLNISFLIMLSVLFGMLSYIFIEKRMAGKKVFALMLMVLALAMFVYISNGKFEAREKSQDESNQVLNTYKNYTLDPTGLFRKCNASLQMLDKGTPQVDDECIASATGGIFLWGDSHMGALSTGLRHEMKVGTPFSQLTSSACAPSFTIKRNGNNRYDIGCDYSNNITYKAILKSKPQIVILGVASKHESVDWENTIAKLYQMGVSKVILIGPFPQWRPSLPMVYVKRHKGEEYISDWAFDKTVLTSNEYLDKLYIQNNSFIFINMLDNLCFNSEIEELNCRAKVGDSLLAFDYGHLTVEASRFIAKNYVVPFL